MLMDKDIGPTLKTRELTTQTELELPAATDATDVKP